MKICRAIGNETNDELSFTNLVHTYIHFCIVQHMRDFLLHTWNLATGQINDVQLSPLYYSNCVVLLQLSHKSSFK